VGIDVVEGDIDALVHGAEIARALHAEDVVLGRAQHDDARAEPQLRMRDAAVGSRIDRMLLEAEGLDEPFDRGRRILVAQKRKDIRLGVRCGPAHVLLLYASRDAALYESGGSGVL
jgi:hypothetical protein